MKILLMHIRVDGVIARLLISRGLLQSSGLILLHARDKEACGLPFACSKKSHYILELKASTLKCSLSCSGIGTSFFN